MSGDAVSDFTHGNHRQDGSRDRPDGLLSTLSIRLDRNDNRQGILQPDGVLWVCGVHMPKAGMPAIDITCLAI